VAAYRKLPATGDANLDRINAAVAEAFAALASPEPFQAATVTGDYGATGTEGVIHVDASAGPVRITLPKPSANMPPLVVKQVNANPSARATFGAVTVVAANGAKTIAGKNSFALDGSGTGSVTFTSDGQQHWPEAAAGGNPPVNPAPPPVPPFVPPPVPPPPSPPPVVVSPWVAPVPFPPSTTFESSTGAEKWAAECLVDFTGAAGISAYWWFESQSQSGSSVFNIRVGGSANGAIDGAIVATFTETTTGPAPHSIVTPITSPLSGLQRVTLTTQSSAGGQLAKILGTNLMFR
jgi:hypothetical protein